MRRIKTYVLMIGVALSVSPIFHFGHAQQSNGSTQLLLDVQALREEVAQLRDLVERQQYQMRRLQQNSGSQSQGRIDQVNNGYVAPNAQYSQPQYGNSGQNLDSSQPQNQQLNSGLNTNGQISSVGPNDYALNDGREIRSDVQLDSRNSYDSYQSEQLNGSQVRSNPNEGLAASQVGEYPPVVDRSFSSRPVSVPVTGAGAQGAVNSTIGSGSSQQEPLNWQQARQQGLEQLPTDSGVISIPQAPTATPLDSSVSIANSRNNNAIDNGAINAGQVPLNNNSQAVPVPNSNARPESEIYSEGIGLLKQSQYEQAAVIFEKQLEAYPRGSLADGAHYWIAEAMFLNRKLDVAKSHLKTIINDYPQSTRIPNAMLKTAYIEQSQGNQIEARILFQEIVALYPQSDAAIAAKNQLASQN